MYIIFFVFSFFIYTQSIIAAVGDPEESVEFYACNLTIGQTSGSASQCSLPSGGSCTVGSPNCLCSVHNTGVTSAQVSFLDSLGVLITQSLWVGAGQTMSLFSENNSWGHKFQDVSISTSSEYYGSEYKLSYCYLGPEKSTGTGSIDLSEGNYAFGISLTSQRLDANLTDYLVEAGLSLVIEVACDLRGVGVKTTSRSRKNGETTPQGIMEKDFFWSGVAGLSANPLIISGDINLNSTQVPRFCILSLGFKEMSQKPHRVNSHLKSNFITNIEIYKKSN